MRRSGLIAAVAAAFVLGAAMGGAPFAHSAAPTAAPAAAPITTGTFAKVAEAIKPAVINVKTETRSVARNRGDESGADDFFKRFYGDIPDRTPQRSLGSGVIIDPSGIALTNAHVVAKASQIDVVLLDGGKRKATLIGLDTKTDLAVLRIGDGKERFPFARLGDSDRMQVGDWVIAVGSPFGLDATVTSGIVSAKARRIGVGPLDDFLQTDAAINPGNSGGPLVNMQGEVIGINTAIVAGGNGVGFAVPSNLARDVYTQLVATGKVSRGWLGVSIQPLTPALAKSFGAKDGKGVLVAEVVPASPAAKAGVHAGDIVLQLDGKPMDEPAALSRAIALSKPGRAVKLTILRDRAEQTLAVTVGAPTERTAVATPDERRPERLGLEVAPVTTEVARELELKDTSGVVVTGVDPTGPAAGVITPRDVIREVNGQPVKTLEDFERLTGAAPKDQPLRVRLQREGSSLYVALALDNK
ncbi:MAG TPA: Do family serine endopeptidase [Methylomirabilota bacterium]